MARARSNYRQIRIVVSEGRQGSFVFVVRIKRADQRWDESVQLHQSIIRLDDPPGTLAEVLETTADWVRALSASPD